MSNIPQENTSKSSMAPETPEEEVIKEIPEETIKETMLLLPVKSLLKFRSVHHSWLSFIDSPYCVKTHLSKSTPKLILKAPQGLFVLDVKTKPKLETLALKEFPNFKTIILGSSNGLLLSHHEKQGVPSFLRDSGENLVQNPYTRTFHKLQFLEYEWPDPSNCITLRRMIIFAFWYDELTDDYKVLRNFQYGSRAPGFSLISKVDVYSLKMQSYKESASFPYYIKDEVESVFVGGALHWVVGTTGWDESHLIGSFDVVTEESRLVEQPLYSSGYYHLFLHVLGGCLSVVCSYFPSRLKEVWVMKEYGNVGSWSKILSISGADIGVESFVYLKPLLYSECGKKVLIERDRKTLLWYDLEKKSAEFLELDKDLLPGQFKAFLHVESLVKLSCSLEMFGTTSCPRDSS